MNVASDFRYDAYPNGTNTNGFKNGATKLTNGLSNFTNGHYPKNSPSPPLTNGYTNGNVNGYTNGYNNGFTNGHTNGHVNGINMSEDSKAPRDFRLQVIQRPWSDAKEQTVRAPYDYLISLPGKDIRTQLIEAFNYYLKVPTESLDKIKQLVGMLHNASLLVDDVEDNSMLRRGYPVAHNIFGVAQTINSGNYIYFCAMQEVIKLKNPECVRVFTEELINLHRGQGMDLFWRDTLTCPSEDDYLEMVSNKTGGLFRLAIKLMQEESESKVDYLDLVNLMGLIFQIRDDYMNLQSDQYAKNKGFAEDLTEGKFSFPIIHSIRTNPSNLQLINILKQHSNDLDLKHYAVAYMRDQTKSFAYTESVLRDLHSQADVLLSSFGNNPALFAILEKLKVEASV